MPTWTRRAQERQGTFQFSGKLYVTQGVLNSLSPEEIVAIYFDIQVLVELTGGIDYFQTYVNDAGDKLYFIDQCDPEMMMDESFPSEYNYCTLLFDHEY
jgi:hypothetical protein